tara:strand:+ start:573 stop:1961 length:1389 start_codon:yes stop_codon:yes gene_type:complete
VNNFIKIILIFIFLANCSLNKNSKFWTSEDIKIEEKNKSSFIEECETKFFIKKCKKVRKNVKREFKKEEALNKEFNSNLKISLYSKPINNSFINNFDNNNGRINYDGNLKKLSRFKFSKIENFFQYNPEILFYKKNIIFFDNKGSILQFNERSKLIWKKNYYSKSEKKQKPILILAKRNKTLIVADNLANYYAVDIDTGKLLWTKKNTAPFNSQIKILKDKFFVIDYENTLRAYSLLDGKEIWNIKTEMSMTRSQKKLSMVIINNKIYFNNSLGDITAVDIEKRQLIWQRPTQSNAFSQDSYSLKNSELIADNSNLYFSNNKNQFYSIELKTGTINWIQKINSSLKPTLIDDYLFTVSKEGFLLIIEKNSGNIIRSTDVLKKFNIKYLWEDKKLRDEITPAGFIVGKKNIYLTTDKGQLLLIDITTGSIKEILKIDKEKISRPFVQNQNLYIIKDNSVLKLN